MTNIRELQVNDNPQYRALWLNAITKHEEFFRTSIEDNSEPNIPTEFSDDSFTLGAFINGELVGILSLMRDSKVKIQHKALLFGMYVEPSKANKGLGKELLHEIISRAKINYSIRQLYLTVLASNERARNLYTSLGFSVFAHEPQSVKILDNYIDEYQMVLFVEK